MDAIHQSGGACKLSKDLRSPLTTVRTGSKPLQGLDSIAQAVQRFMEQQNLPAHQMPSFTFVLFLRVQLCIFLATPLCTINSPTTSVVALDFCLCCFLTRFNGCFKGFAADICQALDAVLSLALHLCFRSTCCALKVQRESSIVHRAYLWQELQVCLSLICAALFLYASPCAHAVLLYHMQTHLTEPSGLLRHQRLMCIGKTCLK